MVAVDAAPREDLHCTWFQRPAFFIGEQRKESGLSKTGIIGWEIRGEELEARESWETFWGLMRWLRTVSNEKCIPAFRGQRSEVGRYGVVMLCNCNKLGVLLTMK